MQQGGKTLNQLNSTLPKVSVVCVTYNAAGTREADNYKFASTYKIERQYKWLGYCASYANNKQPELIKHFYVAYGKRLKSYISMELAGLVYKYRKSVLYIRKKSKLSKLNYVFQQIFGIQAKKIVNNNSK